MTKLTLYESFSSVTLDPRLAWRCEPSHWSIDTTAGRLRLEPDAETDFWQRTHYGFQVDNGHFLFMDVDGPFVLSTHVSFAPAHQYDQAGLMVRLSADCWLKTSVEYEPGSTSRLGVVVTNAGYSDWSTQEVPASVNHIWLRVGRTGADYLVESSPDGETWTQLRMAHLFDDDGQRQVSAGLYACSPKAAGYQATFDFLKIAAGDTPAA
jgi:regulation of enolase protein 1 (concanavalin A-like superfamily)